MTSEQKAQRLQFLAAEMEHADNGAADAALLRECAGMMRERGAVQVKARWESGSNGYYRESACRYKGHFLNVLHKRPVVWIVFKGPGIVQQGDERTVAAAQAAAVAWCDAQEAK